MFPASRTSSRWSRLGRAAAALTVMLAALLSVAGQALAAPAGPDALPVAVIAVKSDDALDQAEALTQALRKAVRSAQGWSLGEASQSLEFLAIKLKCAEPIDAACEAQIADVINADRYLYAVIKFADKSEKSVVGTLGFFVRGQGTKRTTLNYSANLTDPNEDALVKVAAGAFQELTGGPPKGSVKLGTGGVAGQLFIDGKPIGALPAQGGTYPLPAGEHRIVVKSPGYSDAETTVNVRPLLTADATLTMVEVDTGGSSVDGKVIGGIAGLVVGAGALGVGIYGMVQVNGVKTDADWDLMFNDIANVNADNMCTDKLATSVSTERQTALCDQADTGELMQVIGFPVAAVAGGVGIYLLATSSLAGGDEDEGATALTVTPIITPDLQAVSLTYKF